MKDMKRAISLCIISVLLISLFAIMFVNAQSNNTQSIREQIREQIQENREQREQLKNETQQLKENITELRDEIKLRIKQKNITIREVDQDRLELITEKINAKTGLNLTVEDIKSLDGNTTGQILRAFLSNGRWAEVKIMPDSASQTALDRLRAKCVERNCTIELKEVGKLGSNESKLAYEVSTQKESRVLLLFRKKMPVMAQVDAETGEIIKVKKPWWQILAREESD